MASYDKNNPKHKELLLSEKEAISPKDIAQNYSEAIKNFKELTIEEALDNEKKFKKDNDIKSLNKNKNLIK